MNALNHLDEFKKVLSNYKVSTTGKKVLADSKLVLCSAATATGRNTVIRELVKTNRYYFIVSDTTRKPRVNDGQLEKNGVEYWFRTEEDMLADLKAGKLVEAEIIHNQQVSGMSIREIEKSVNLNKVAITDADRGGVQLIKPIKPDTICIFFLPPSFETWQQRIKNRGHMSPEEYRRRLATARLEIKNALDAGYYHFVINDKLEDTVKGVQKIVEGVIDPKHEADGKQVAKEILAKL